MPIQRWNTNWPRNHTQEILRLLIGSLQISQKPQGPRECQAEIGSRKTLPIVAVQRRKKQAREKFGRRQASHFRVEAVRNISAEQIAVEWTELIWNGIRKAKERARRRRINRQIDCWNGAAGPTEEINGCLRSYSRGRMQQAILNKQLQEPSPTEIKWNQARHWGKKLIVGQNRESVSRAQGREGRKR